MGNIWGGQKSVGVTVPGIGLVTVLCATCPVDKMDVEPIKNPDGSWQYDSLTSKALYQDNTACTDLKATKFNNVAGNSKCDDCPLGTFSDPARKDTHKTDIFIVMAGVSFYRGLLACYHCPLGTKGLMAGFGYGG